MDKEESSRMINSLIETRKGAPALGFNIGHRVATLPNQSNPLLEKPKE